MKTVNEIISARNAYKNKPNGFARWRIHAFNGLATFERECPALRARLERMIRECGKIRIIEKNGFVTIHGTKP